MADTLLVILRVGRLAVEEAQRSLAECLGAEMAAAEALSALDAAITAETDAASHVSADDRAVEGFGAWLQRITVDRRAAATALMQAETRSAEARAVLASCRSSVRAAEALLATQAEAARIAGERKEQAALDEAAVARPTPQRL